MCGITGIYYNDREKKADLNVLKLMADKLYHRGPDDINCVAMHNVGFGFRRLSIIDLTHGAQPFYSPDKSIMLICNGEIYNYKELRRELGMKGYTFNTDSDIEVLVSMYMEYGHDFLKRLNGQFAVAIYDSNKDLLLLARDHFGICPLFYTEFDGALIFGSEMKAILEYPGVPRKIDPHGLDHLFTFPAIISPTTLLDNVRNLDAGHYLIYQKNKINIHEYWDLEYPDQQDIVAKNEDECIEQLDELLKKSIKYRLHADVPVGFYLSGGLDSSLIGGMMKSLDTDKKYDSFSICFSKETENKAINEQKYQRLMSNHLNTTHNEIDFSWSDFDSKLKDVVYFSESPLKETYNVCSLALSKAARDKNIKVVLSGEGSDELFGGYAGYKFDLFKMNRSASNDLNSIYEQEVRRSLWGDEDFIYEKNEYEFKETKSAIYSKEINQIYNNFDCLSKPIINVNRLKGKHVFHKRSYVDFKLRLAGHLISDHGDRMSLANSVECRYPFLDVELIEFIKTIPPDLMLKNMNEKYLLKQVAAKYIPDEIINREKFGFVAPGSSNMLKNELEWINDLLSYDTIKRHGYFDPDTIERLKKIYMRDNFILNPPYDIDLLIIVLTFNVFMDVFKVSPF